MVGLGLFTPCLGAPDPEDSDRDLETERDSVGRNINELSQLVSHSCPDHDKCGQRISSHRSRWFALTMYSVAAFMQELIWNTWGPIASSAFLAFPSWNSHSLALLNNWGSLMYIIFIIPSCWLLSKHGLRTSFLLASFLSLIGTGVRCCSTENETLFTVLAHVGAILNGMSGVILGPAPTVLSSVWFPRNQRIFATGVGTALSQLGMAGSYLLGPFIVSAPLNSTKTTSKELRRQISTLMTVDFSFFVAICILLFLFYPNKPPTPPSRTSLIKRLDFEAALKNLLRSSNIWLLGTASALCLGVTGPWMSMITVIFSSKSITEEEADALGMWTLLCICLMGVLVTAAADLAQGHLKVTLLILLTSSSIMFMWILLLTTEAITFHKDQLYISVVLGMSFSGASPALFFELAAEIAYPVPEGVVSGYIATLCNISSVFFLFIYILPAIGVGWMNYCLFLYSLGSIVAMILVDEQYNRLTVDNNPNSGKS